MGVGATIIRGTNSRRGGAAEAGEGKRFLARGSWPGNPGQGRAPQIVTGFSGRAKILGELFNARARKLCRYV